jgi:hypothetical protein
VIQSSLPASLTKLIVADPTMRAPPIVKANPRIDCFATSVQEIKKNYPAAIFNGHEQNCIRPATEPNTFLRRELETPRLNAIHDHLWLAGLPTAARPLHRQRLLGRNVLITENPDEHLVWFETQISIKPLPDYLLCYDYWNEHLCTDENLFQSACGMLLSYAWLICYESDLDIAKDIGLMPKDIKWSSWTMFLGVFLNNINLVTLRNVNKRYNYGELRLSRLNAIYRLMPPAYSLRNLIRGYRTGSTWYDVFFKRHFGWLFAVFATFSVLLSALQVGLATSILQTNAPFQTIAYDFTIVSLVIVSVGVILIFVTWVVLFWYHLLSSWRYNKATKRKRGRGTNCP